MVSDTVDKMDLDIDNLTTLEEMQKAYDIITEKKMEKTTFLNEALKEKDSLDTKVNELVSVLPSLSMLESDAERLRSMINFTCSLAENISSKVRQLDLAKSRVFEAIQRVDDILDLKFCTDGVKQAMESKDYEQAAAHIHRYLCLDENVIQQSATGSMESSSVTASLNVLREARVEMSKVVSEQFDTAMTKDDLNGVERFFKIFPLLKMEDDGLEKFSKFLCAEIGKSSKENINCALSLDSSDKRYNVIFADTLTLLFEGLARTVEKQQPLVETYYGPGKLFILVKNLQKECDNQANIILNHFKDVRKYQQKIQQVQNAYINRSGKSTEDFRKQAFDPRSLEALLSEVMLISSRCELYLRFVRRRVTADIDIVYQNEEEKVQKKNNLDTWLASCELNHSLQEVIGGYILMEEYYMRESVNKAIQMNSAEEGSFTSSMVDDTFFILKQCIKRAMGSSAIDCVCAMLNHATTVLDSDYKDVLIARIKAGFPSGGMLDNISSAYNVVQSSFQGKIQSVDEQNATMRHLFLTNLNDCEVSSQHVQTLKRSLQAEVTNNFQQLSSQGNAKFESCLQDLAGLSSNFRDLLDTGISDLSQACIKPEIRPLITNFLSISHIISDNEFASYEANDPWVENLLISLQQLVDKFREALSDEIYDQLVSHLTNEIATQLEKVVFKSSFNRLGGMQFDKELRALVGFLTSMTTWTIRDRFARLTQTATILNLENVIEILDYWGANSGSLTWRLTPAEIRRILSMRVDFKSEEIRKLKL